MGATEARVRFGALIRMVVGGGGPVLVQKDGGPKVVALPVAEHERLVAAADPLATWLERVDLLRERVKRELDGRALPPAEALIDGGRDERDDHLTGLH